MNSTYLHVAMAHHHLTIDTVPSGDESLSNKRVTLVSHPVETVPEGDEPLSNKRVALVSHPVETVPRGDESLVDLRVALAAHHLALDTVAARA